VQASKPATLGGRTVTVSADPRIGSEFLGYRIEALLGRGGMSVVYRAEHLRLKRKVALKLIAPELAEDERFRERFLRESELAASLDHPHIVPIYDAGEVDGQLYIAMRYVAGGDLKRLLREHGRLEPGRALALLSQVADALDAAHEAGLVHRDVKPGNVLFDSREYCYLSDFGLTKQVSSQSGFTATGQIVGTIDYVAPEVIEGKELTASADLYSLGCLLYECLAGEPPFHKDSEFAVLWAHVNEPPPKLSERRPELPTELDAVLAKALAKAPEKRYASGRELVEAAREALPTLAAAPHRRTRRLLIGAAVAAVVAVAIALPLILAGGGAKGPSSKPTLAVKTDSVQHIDPKTNKLVATIAVPVDDGLLVAGGGSIWAANGDQNRLFRIDPKRNAVVQTIQTVDPRGFSFGAGSLWVLDASDAVVTQFDPASGAATATVSLPPGTLAAPPPASLAASADAVWVQWAARTGNAVRIDPRSRAARAVTLGSPSISLVRDFAPAGAMLWALIPDPQVPSSDAVLRVDLAKGNSRARIVRTGTTYGNLVADRTGAWFTDALNDRALHIDKETGRIDRRVAVGDFPSWIAEGEGAVWVANQGGGTISRIDPATGKVVATIQVGTSPDTVTVGAGGVWVDVHPS
jgi:YVTN family beta-propeller protein